MLCRRTRDRLGVVASVECAVPPEAFGRFSASKSRHFLTRRHGAFSWGPEVCAAGAAVVTNQLSSGGYSSHPWLAMTEVIRRQSQDGRERRPGDESGDRHQNPVATGKVHGARRGIPALTTEQLLTARPLESRVWLAMMGRGPRSPK
jgi:hypothetical protein